MCNEQVANAPAEEIDRHDTNNSAWSEKASRVLDGPSLEYEQARRAAARDVKELWWFVRYGLLGILKKNELEDAKAVATEILEGGRHRKAAILADMDKMREADGHDSWRRQVSKIAFYRLQYQYAV